MLIRQKWPSLTNEAATALRHLTVNIMVPSHTLLGMSKLSPKNIAATGGLQNPFIMLQLRFLLLDEKLTRSVTFHFDRSLQLATEGCHFRKGQVLQARPTLTPDSPTLHLHQGTECPAKKLNEGYGGERPSSNPSQYWLSH